ncbi:MAG: methyltransferase domain-containing protein [Burkholderiales bacterium]|nr:methyltransferase domain-containing protein [Burkholderiales bacterium]
MENSLAQLAAWLDTPLGQYLLAREQDYFDQTVADVFGFNALQLGLLQCDFLRTSRIPLRVRINREGHAHRVGILRADFRELPIASNSADLVVLPHILEFSEDPHQILREVARILVPEGQVLISGFNPWSLWGLRRPLRPTPGDSPWCGRFINLPRLKDWLALLEFEVAAGKMCCYAPPITQEKWLSRFQFMETAGDRWWPIAGGVYFVQAVKRVRGMRLIMPKWNERRASQKQLAAVPQKLARGRVGPPRRRQL